MKQNKKTKSRKARASVNIISLIGFALSIVSFFLNFFGLTSLISGLISVVGFFEVKESGEKGKIFAILGIVVSVLTLIMGLVTMFIFMANR